MTTTKANTGKYLVNYSIMNWDETEGEEGIEVDTIEEVNKLVEQHGKYVTGIYNDKGEKLVKLQNNQWNQNS